MEPFIGQIQVFPYNFAPRGWAFCHGQLLPISENTALFSLIGTIYGGDGRTTFALPDLRGRVAIGEGTGPGLTNRRLGERGGSEMTTLTVANMPNHTHNFVSPGVSIPVSEEDADQDEANGKYLANGTFYHNSSGGAYGGGPVPVTGTNTNTGGQQPFHNMEPYLGLHYCIALVGIFPSRG